MPKPIQFNYSKKDPARDATYVVVVCEGRNREPDYFQFFEGLSSRVKLVVVPNEDHQSAPLKLISNALDKEKEIDDFNPREDKTWFVIDTDRWREQIRELRNECTNRPHWQVVQSNPCFEVWLYYHAKRTLPNLEKIDQCGQWKSHLPEVILGGFNSDFHPIAIEVATENAKITCEETGDTPHPGSTQVWRLTEMLFPVIKKDLEDIKHKFPPPELVG